MFTNHNASVILTLMPPPVMGASLLYVAGYLVSDKSSVSRMSGFIIQLIVEKVPSTADGDQCTVALHSPY
jgi:hypothetical protein